jgi:hypothetical protein
VSAAIVPEVSSSVQCPISSARIEPITVSIIMTEVRQMHFLDIIVLLKAIIKMHKTTNTTSIVIVPVV